MKRGPQEQGSIPTVSRVCSDTLVELVYDREARKTALAVSRFGGLWNIEREVRIETGEVLVPYSPQNNLIDSECVYLPSHPEEYGEKHVLLADIRAFLHRYVDLSPEFELVASYYVLLTWVHDAFSELPYLRLQGDYGTGKTRGLLAIGSLCYRSFFASGASTVSPIFHTLDAFGGTLVLDEADFAFSDANADIVKLLNNGTVRGIPVLRSVVNRYKEFNPYAFKVFGPKLIAMREGFEDRALESRFLTEETGTRALRPDISIPLPATLRAESLALRNRLLHYRFSHFYEIKTDATALIAGAAPRLNQTAISLLSLVDDGAERATIQGWLMERSASGQAAWADRPEARVLGATIKAFSSVRDGMGPSIGDIAMRANELGYGHEAPISSKWAGSILRKAFHIETRKTNGVYIVPWSEHTKLVAIAARHNLAVSVTSVS